MTIRRVGLDRTGVTLEVQEEGAGGRPLLLLHGYTGAKEDFADHLSWLAGLGWHAVAPDQRGHGASDGPAEESAYGLAVFAADALALADALGWDRFTVLGHSMGGMVAQVLLLDAPDRVDRIALMGTGHGPVKGLDPQMVAAGRQIVAAGGMAALLEATRAMDAPLDTPAHARLLAERPGYREWNDAKLLASSPEMWLALSFELLEQPDRLDALAALPRRPAVVLVGEQDRPFLGASQRLAEALGARLVVIDEAGHSPQLEAPAAWRAALLPFFEA